MPHQYLGLILAMASQRPLDVVSMRTVLAQARNSLDDGQYDALVGYRQLFDPERLLFPRPGL